MTGVQTCALPISSLTPCSTRIRWSASDTGTDRLIDAARLARLPRHAVLYNVGRGNCIDEAALARALQTGTLRGACLDVFAREPLAPDSPLAADLPGLVRMPHASAFADAYMDRFMDEVITWLSK